MIVIIDDEVMVDEVVVDKVDIYQLQLLRQIN